MKNRLLTIFCFTLLINIANGQADLVCTNINNSQTTLIRGQKLLCSFRIKNIGTSTSSVSHTGIYLVDSATYNVIHLADVSTESLLPSMETSDYEFICPVPHCVLKGKSSIYIQANSTNEVVESNTNNNISISSNKIIFNQSNVTIPSLNSAFQNLPYPIILMHGWGGNDTTWYPFLRDMQTSYGFSYGGNMNFCLNQDGDVTKSNLSNDFKDWSNFNAIHVGDFYTINFDVDTSGNKYPTTSVQSNQSGAVKQGLAIRNAITHVLAKTGRDKVILVCHSMGGLAAREYLQNSYNWQSDGNHHVAKLLTIGTPHGGSNATSINLTSLLGLDERSEAVRDLRTSYAISGSKGVYLFGGVESLSVMNNSLVESYYNADVNCNGQIGNNIIGLNSKTIPHDLAYSCVVGVDTYPITACSPTVSSVCDGVVGNIEANLNSYFPILKADTFVCTGLGSPGHPWHLDEPKQSSYIIRGFDEPDTKDNAYEINLGSYTFGHFSFKNTASFSSTDSDYYKIKTPSSGNLILNIYNIPTSKTFIKVIDSSSNTLISYTKSLGKGYISIPINGINKGTFFINLYSTPDSNSWKTPYAINFSFNTYIPLSGRIVNANNKPIYHVYEKLSGDSTLITNTDSLGSYQFDLLHVGNYTITPSKNNDINKSNGLTTLDLVYVQSHILGKSLLNSPYKIIAADVNGDGKITTLDLVYIKRLILGLDTTFTNSTTKENRLWAFVDSSYKFPDSTNPFPFKDSISYIGLSANKTNQTFIGIKLGDVNWDWNPALAKMPSPVFIKPKNVIITE